LFASINAADLAFVVHVGDFENDGQRYTRDPSAGPMPCTAEVRENGASHYPIFVCSERNVSSSLKWMMRSL
jgi:hypothetical protein